MTRRRLLEILVAAALLIALLAIFLVRPTAHRTAPPPAALFHAVPGVPPDFTGAGEAFLAAGSPDGSRTAVLFPTEFEVPADLYVVRGPGDGTRFQLADSLRETWTPRAVGWLDDHTLWVTIGWLYGTVSPGGDLYAVDPTEGSARLLWASPDSGRTQAVAARAGGSERGIVVRLKAFDENLLAARDSTLELPPDR